MDMGIFAATKKMFRGKLRRIWGLRVENIKSGFNIIEALLGETLKTFFKVFETVERTLLDCFVTV